LKHYRSQGSKLIITAAIYVYIYGMPWMTMLDTCWCLVGWVVFYVPANTV